MSLNNNNYNNDEFFGIASSLDAFILSTMITFLVVSHFNTNETDVTLPTQQQIENEIRQQELKMQKKYEQHILSPNTEPLLT